jgi:hypothetical protein
MKSRSASEWVNAYDTIHQELTVEGFKPKLQTLDNEASAALKNIFIANDVEYQLVPPHCHRRNAAERAIRTFKEHFVSGLSSVDRTFPLHFVKLLPLPQPPVRARTDARTNPSAQRATQLRSVLARVYDVSIQNQITTTVP